MVTLKKDESEQWWRCNDNEIRKAEFFEIEREGYGGSAGDPSAYILLYQRKSQYVSDSNFQDEAITSDLLEMVQVHDQTHGDISNNEVSTGSFLELSFLT